MQDFEKKYFDNISKNLKDLREGAGLSQEDLAEKLGCSREFLNRVENRKENLSLKMLLKAAQFFKIQPQQMFNE